MSESSDTTVITKADATVTTTKTIGTSEYIVFTPKIESIEEKESVEEKIVKETIKSKSKGYTVSSKISTTSNKYIILDNYFHAREGDYEILKRNISKNINTLLVGETGSGKTELVAAIAKELNLPLNIFDMGTMTDPISSLIGNHVIQVKDGKAQSDFFVSRFSKIIQEPGIILLDELNRASVTANNLLFPCLDFRRELPMEYSFYSKEPIKVHPDCTFIATANVGSQYTGTHKLDSALKDRFMIMRINVLGEEQLKILIVSKYKNIEEDKINKIVKVFLELNEKNDNFESDVRLSTRHIHLISSLVDDGFTIYDAFYSVCSGISDTGDIKQLIQTLTA